jgi:catechol 2,3-dioxygenase-like lactoylglutathione lyase family enzyme
MLNTVTIGPVIPVSDLGRSVAFYEQDLGLEGEPAPGGYRLRTPSGGAIFLLAGTDYAGQAEWPLVSIETVDLDALVADLAGRGVATAKGVPYAIDDRGISTQDGIRIAWYTDPDGQVISVFELTG